MRSIVWTAGFLAGVVALAGCSKPAPEPETAPSAAPATPAAPRREAPQGAQPPPPPESGDLFRTKPVAAPPAQEGSIPVRLCTMLRGSDGVRAGLIDDRSGQSSMVREGQTFAGYEVVRLDDQAEKAVLRKDGVEFTIGVTGTPFPAVVPPPVPASTESQIGGAAPPSLTGQPSMPPGNIDTMPPPPKFDPLPFETERGIDPNDPKTWPADYRGPGIERAMRDPNFRMEE